jgi:hypothetical protein
LKHPPKVKILVSEDHKKRKRAEKNRRYRERHLKEDKRRKREYFLRNKQSIARKFLERKKRDIPFRLSCNLRVRLCCAIKKRCKAGSAVNDLGCSIAAFKKYIEGKFQSGMSWDNWGKWHLDHIAPLSSFDLTDRSQFLIAAHYTNYQPLWAEDNLKKGNRVVGVKNDSHQE